MPSHLLHLYVGEDWKRNAGAINLSQAVVDLVKATGIQSPMDVHTLVSTRRDVDLAELCEHLKRQAELMNTRDGDDVFWAAKTEKHLVEEVDVGNEWHERYSAWKHDKARLVTEGAWDSY